jgi:hypothetical protein
MQTARMFDTSPILPEGVFDSHGTPVTPQSLYLAQLSERLGPQALGAIGYTANDISAFPDKTTPPLPELRAVIDPELGPNLALHRPVNATSSADNLPAISGDRAVDGDDRTYWSPPTDAKHMTLEIDTEGPLDINGMSLGEAQGFESHVQEYKVEGQVDSDWRLLAHGASIGDRTVTRFPKVTVWKVRLTIAKSQGSPAISEFGLFLTNDPSVKQFSKPTTTQSPP